MKLTHLTLPLAIACGSSSPDKSSGYDHTGSGPPPLDVTERLGEGEVRAGPVVDGGGLFGGVSAEAREGDFKIYNAQAQFIVQGMRDGDYYEAVGGGVIDADMVRPEGVPGRDVVDELGVMAGFGRLVQPTSITVVADGSDGEAAVVRVEGVGTPMTLLTGALESDTIVPDLSVAVVTEYTLAPDSYHLEAVTTLTWQDVLTDVQAGDIVMAGMEAVDTILPGRGLSGGERDATGEWMGVVGRENQVAMAVFSDDIPFSTGAVETLLSEIGPVLAPLRVSEPLDTGDTLTYRRTFAVGPDLAALTAEWHTLHGRATTAVGGTVTAGGEPVAGARVHLMDGDDLETVAFTDASGRWSAEVTASAPLAIATGRGHGEWVDLPPGAGWVAPYAHPDVAGPVLDTLASGSEGSAFAEGYGVSEAVAATADTALSLTPPGTLAVTVADGGPAMVRVDFAAGDPVTADRARVPGRPGGAVLFGYVRDGDLELPVEPGEYTVTVHRGLRFEPVQESVTVTSGETTSLSADLALAVDPEGFLALDPHSHASPSGDGEIVMSHRLLTMAANGVQVHFGTDHDHVADYRPLLAPLGLDDVLASVVANEASPVLRGHTNVYPVSPIAGVPNAGAPRWWTGFVDTETWYADLRAWAGPDALIQLNHPAGSSGMLGVADYDIASGTVGKPSHFSEGFDAIEVLNDGEHGEFFALYLDLISRGYSTVPTGVSDAHGYRNGVGENLTWLPVGLDSPADLTDAALVAAMRAGGTCASRGPFLDVRVDGDWAPGTTVTGSPALDVAITAASFVQVDTLVLLENGVEVDRVATSTGTSFELDPSVDAHYVVVASGSTPMAPVYDQTPWAMCAAVKVDVAGDGWTPPLPALGMGG